MPRFFFVLFFYCQWGALDVKCGSEVEGLVLVQSQTFGKQPLQTYLIVPVCQHGYLQDFARQLHIHDIDYLGLFNHETWTPFQDIQLGRTTAPAVFRELHLCFMLSVSNTPLMTFCTKWHLLLMTYEGFYQQRNCIFFWLRCNFVTVKSLMGLNFSFQRREQSWSRFEVLWGI